MSQSYLEGQKPASEIISDSTTSHASKEVQVGTPQLKSTSYKKTSKTSSSRNGTIDHTKRKSYHPLPVKNPKKKAWLEQQKNRKPEEVIQSEFLNNVWTICEIRDNAKNEVAKLNAGIWGANKILPDRVTIDRRSLEVQVSSQDLIRILEALEAKNHCANPVETHVETSKNVQEAEIVDESSGDR